MVAVGFPNPVGWAVDKVTGFVSGAAASGFEMIIGGLVAWVVDAVVWIVGGVFNFFLDSTDPNVQADWFVTGTGPYATTVSIGAGLLLLFVLAGIVQGTLNGDAGGMLRRMVLDLPVSVLGMVGLVTVTQALIRLTDVLSMHVMGNFQDDIAQFGTVVASLQALNGGTSTAFVVFVLGLATVLAGLILVAELVIRASLVYIVVALAPLVFAARLWPATREAARKLLDLLCALILSKLVIAIALAVAAAAAVGSGSGGEVTALPEPEVFAEDPGGSVTQAVGILLSALAGFGVAAFSPLLTARLLPMTEAAVVAQGVRGGPARAGQQGLMMANTMRMASGHRLNQLATGKAGGAGGPTSAGAGPKPAALGAARPGAGAALRSTGAGTAAGPVGVATAATASAAQAARGAVSAGAESATRPAQGGSPAERTPGRRPDATRRPPPSAGPARTSPPSRPGPSKGASDGT